MTELITLGPPASEFRLAIGTMLVTLCDLRRVNYGGIIEGCIEKSDRHVSGVSTVNITQLRAGNTIGFVDLVDVGRTPSYDHELNPEDRKSVV